MTGIDRLLFARRDAAGLGAFRILFGTLMLFGTVRFAARGWIEELYILPNFHFTYFGLHGIRPLPDVGMYVVFAGLALSSAAIACGVFTRGAATIFFLLFTYVELLEKAAYLNHYYFVSLIALLLVFVPSDRAFSLASRRRKRRACADDGMGSTVPSWAYLLLRAQVGIVYFYAGFAKLNADWLLRAEPLRTWLGAHADAPLFGPLIALPETAYAMSWAGAAFDLSIPLWLSLRRTRRPAFLAVMFFHVFVWLLFPIGIFSWVMISSATLFFDASWPRVLLFSRRALKPPEAPPMLRAASSSPRRRTLVSVSVASYLLVQSALPLRFLIYPGNVLWTEQGFRFAWRVMLIEKTGQVEYEVIADGRRFRVYPRRELTPLQYRMLSTQPDMVHDYARHLAERHRALGYRRVAVHAHAWASLNGRPRQRFVDPRVDLGATAEDLGVSSFLVALRH